MEITTPNFGIIQLDKPDQVGIVVNNVIEMVEQFKKSFWN